MNTKLGQKEKIILWKIFSSWWIIAFGKTTENVRNHTDIKIEINL